MCDVFDYIEHELGERAEEDVYKMTALAFYMQAVCEREREHVPLIGPSVDRRTLALLTRVANSENICSLVCFACAQVFTHVRTWDRMFDDFRDRDNALAAEARQGLWQHHCTQSDIRYRTVASSLLKHLERYEDGFRSNFDLRAFTANYGTEKQPGDNPFANASELAGGNYEWQRVLKRGSYL